MVVDLSIPITPDVPTFPGYPEFEAEALQSYETDGKRSHSLSLNTHMGTHIDAPAHFVESGRRIGELTLDELTGSARVVDLRDHRGEQITADVLATAAPTIEEPIALLLTGDVDESFGEPDFFDEAAVLTDDAAEWLVEQDLTAIGNDFLTEAIDTPARPVHHRILGEDVPIIEYLGNISAVVDADTVEFACLPLSIPDVEAAPARAVCKL